MLVEVCRSAVLPALFALCLAPLGCNLLTGADDLKVKRLTGEGGDDSSSDAASAASTGATSGAGGGSGGAGATTSGAGGAVGDCAAPCGANQYCEAATNTCVCDPGFVMEGGACNPAPVGDPTTHTQDDVCGAWATGHVVTENAPLVASGQECDPGSLTQAALVDTLVRINMFRYLVGLGPTTDDPALNTMSQWCANLESWWDWSLPNSPHAPPAGVKCYSAEGASGAGQSNIAWGSGHPAQAIDQYMEDWGNETTMGHRRWILNPPLGPVGIGYWQTGGQYGNAQCLAVFGSSGGGPHPSWYAWPPPGFVPVEAAGWTWTLHGSIGGVASAAISVLRVDDNTPLAVTVLPLSQGYAEDTQSWVPNGWTVEAGKTYRVTATGVGSGSLTYDVKPVVCN